MRRPPRARRQPSTRPPDRSKPWPAASRARRRSAGRPPHARAWRSRPPGSLRTPTAFCDAWVTAASRPAITGRRTGSFAKIRPAATARHSAPSPNEPAPASNHGTPARRWSTVATTARPGTRRLRTRLTRRSLDNRRGADPMGEKRIRRDEELLHARAHLAGRTDEPLARELVGVDELSRATRAVASSPRVARERCPRPRRGARR